MVYLRFDLLLKNAFALDLRICEVTHDAIIWIFPSLIIEAYTLNLKAYLTVLGFRKSFDVLNIGRLVVVWPLAW